MIKTTAKPWGNLEAPLGHISIVLSLTPVLAETPGYNFTSAVGTLHLAYTFEDTVVVNKRASLEMCTYVHMALCMYP